MIDKIGMNTRQKGVVIYPRSEEMELYDVTKDGGERRWTTAEENKKTWWRF